MFSKRFTSFLLSMTFLFLSTSPAHATLEYFGYYNVNGFNPVDSRDHIPEIGARGNSNIGVITVSDIPKLPQYLTEMRENKMYAILGVSAMFEQPRREQIWTAIKRVIKGYEDVVYGFYFDESVWRGVGVSDFRSYTSQIRADFPDKATILVEAYPIIDWNTMPAGYLDYITDIGFDYYPIVEMKGDTTKFEAGWANYQRMYQKFEAIVGNRKVWLVPDGYGQAGLPTSYIATVLQRYYQHAISHPAVVGMLVFRYDPGDGSTYYTVQDTLNPNSIFYDAGVVHTNISVGRAIIANSSPYPTALPISSPTPTASPTQTASPLPTYNFSDLEPDGDVDFNDFLILISNFGTIGELGWIRSDIIKNGVVDVFDFNKLVSNYSDM